MAATNADTFKATLQQIESSKDPAALVALFGDDATVDSPSRQAKLSGRESIRHFWAEYLAAFTSVHSTFTTEHTIGDTSILQWVSDGTLLTGKPVHYRGVSIVTFKGYKVATFTTYYDSAAFVTPAAETTTKAGPSAHASNTEGGD